MASIERRGDSFRIVVSAGYDSAGNKYRESITYKPEARTPKAIEKEVEEFARDFEKRVLNGEYYSGEKMTFEQFAKVWEENWLNRSDLTTRIKDEYKRKLYSKFVPELGHMKMSKIKAVHIDNILHKMTDEGKAPKTVRHYYTVVNSVFRYAFKKQVIKENPCLRCDDLPKVRRDNELHYFTLEQAKTFLKALDLQYNCEYGKRTRSDKSGNEYIVKEYTSTHSIPFMYKVFFSLAIYGGFRRGEICALTWEDIDFEKKSVSINKSLSKTISQGQFVKEPKTASSIREIMLPEECFRLLSEWKQEEVQLSWKLGSAWKGKRGKDFDKNSVFIKLVDGTTIDIDTPTHKFKEIIELYNSTVEKEEDKLPNIRLHDLRHTSATLLLASNTDIETVSHRLGHSRASITLDVYGHALETMDEKASNTLERMFAN